MEDAAMRRRRFVRFFQSSCLPFFVLKIAGEFSMTIIDRAWLDAYNQYVHLYAGVLRMV